MIRAENATNMKGLKCKLKDYFPFLIILLKDNQLFNISIQIFSVLVWTYLYYICFSCITQV